ncbi:MAG: heavy metal translocating P-type ATPase, partial [Betaproteobacteria bacterium]|nr:heavy metal translocating P-type ATPase [Betaproteobacteria bacterium]
LPVVLYSAQTFYRGAWHDIRARHIGMDTPVALAIVATFGTSLWALLAGAGSLYFDAIAMFVFLLLAARYLESGAREAALSHIERLANAAPAVAQRLTHYPHDRQSETVATASLQRGDTILIATGQTVAADGNLIEGDSEFDETLLTGEARPTRHTVGERVWGGSQNCASPVIVRVTGVGADSLLTQISRLAEEAAQQRSPVSGLTERIARQLAPAILLLAAVAAFLWLWIDPRQSFNVLVAVLAVSCPCAIALAAPAAYAAAAHRLATKGLLISRSHVLATAAHISDVIFDKTGTLTCGNLTITRVQPLTGLSEATVLALAAALEKGAAHPIARAITAALSPYDTEIAPAHGLRLVPGLGVEGIIENSRYRFGTAAFIREIASLPEGSADGGADSGAWVLARDGEALATFEASDPLRADAAATVKHLQAMGVQVHLLSGDQPVRVQAVAAALGIEAARVRAAQLPAEKLAYLNILKANGATTLMVGDGVNDAPVLAAADISLVMGNGADLTRLAADSVLLSPHLAVIADSLSLARRCARIISQNFVWSLGYNALAIPLAMANRVTPAEAAIGMAVSSLVVVANSLRVGRCPALGQNLNSQKGLST